METKETLHWWTLYGHRKKAWMVIVSIATTLSLIYAVRNVLGSIALDRPIDWVWGVGFEFTYWLVWAAYTPLVLWVATRFSLDRLSGSPFVLALLGFGIIVAFAQSATEWGLVLVIERLRHVSLSDFARDAAKAKRDIPLGTFGNLIIYSLIIAGHYGYQYYRGFRERQLRSAQLETLLARSDLQNLKAQLQPHFLFNALNTISVLMRRDPAAANRMLVRLSDLLRMSLNNVGKQDVSLREELRFLDGYLEIEQTRFQDRMRIRRWIEAETLEAAVPNLILQPLVENAIRHGIARKTGPGTIEILAKRDGGNLRLEVKDDGPGLAQAQTDDGVGLAITKRRLQQLYGARHQFQLEERAEDGVHVKITIPFRAYDHE